jgi:thiosulfate reductase/polysulfide reductase chain A
MIGLRNEVVTHPNDTLDEGQMTENIEKGLTRRNFLKIGTAAGVAAAVGGHTRLLHALVKTTEQESPSDFRNVFSLCDLCVNKCALIARVNKSGIVQKLDPNPKFLKSRGMLCARGNAGIAQLYDPDRLKYPLLRKGERGAGQWQRLSWDQALDHAAEKLLKIAEKYTRCGVLFMAGSDTQSEFVERFANVFGSFNYISHESNCLISLNRAFVDTFGEVPLPDILNCKYVILAGANRFEALITPDSMDLMTAMQQGCKLVVLDPRFTKTAALAHEWHAIRPGTDMAFFLAIAHVLIEEQLYDRAFVAEKTSGFEQLADHVKPYAPEWAEKECQIPAADIRRIARELAAAAPAAMVYPGRRSSDYTNSTQIRRSFAIVNALLGNFDRPGGLTVPAPIKMNSISYDAPWYDDNPKERIDTGRSSMMFEEEGSFKHCRDAVIEGKPYPVKGFFVYKTNPMATGANRRKTIEMIHKLDFLLTVDMAMSDTAWMSDLVLPMSHYLERQDPIIPMQGVSAGCCLVTRDPVIPAQFESKPIFWIVQELAKRLDLGEYFDFTMAQFREKQLEGYPEASAALQQDGVYPISTKLYGVYEGKPFKTPTKKIELYCQRYKQSGIDPLPVYVPPREVPADRFRLVAGRCAYITQTSTTNNALLNELLPENVLWIHPQAASRLGIHPGDRVEVSSKVGKGTLNVYITEKIRSDTVYMENGFGLISPALTRVFGKGASIVEIMEDDNDAISGSMAMHETIVSVRRV